MYKIFYYMMLIGYMGLSIQAPTLKTKAIGIVLLIANGLIFWK